MGANMPGRALPQLRQVRLMMGDVSRLGSRTRKPPAHKTARETPPSRSRGASPSPQPLRSHDSFTKAVGERLRHNASPTDPSPTADSPASGSEAGLSSLLAAAPSSAASSFRYSSPSSAPAVPSTATASSWRSSSPYSVPAVPSSLSTASLRYSSPSSVTATAFSASLRSTSPSYVASTSLPSSLRSISPRSVPVAPAALATSLGSTASSAGPAAPAGAAPDVPEIVFQSPTAAGHSASWRSDDPLAASVRTAASTAPSAIQSVGLEDLYKSSSSPTQHILQSSPPVEPDMVPDDAKSPPSEASAGKGSVTDYVASKIKVPWDPFMPPLPGCIRTAVHRRRRGGNPHLNTQGVTPPPPPSTPPPSYPSNVGG